MYAAMMDIIFRMASIKKEAPFEYEALVAQSRVRIVITFYNEQIMDNFTSISS